jgi:hypothetical protein
MSTMTREIEVEESVESLLEAAVSPSWLSPAPTKISDEDVDDDDFFDDEGDDDLDDDLDEEDFDEELDEEGFDDDLDDEDLEVEIDDDEEL